MSSSTGHIEKRLAAITVIIVLLMTNNAFSQDGILDKKFTFSEGILKAGSALESISRNTGYYFTYDSRIIDDENRITLNVKDLPLRVILDSVFRNDSIRYSVINNHIIIYKVHGDTVSTNSESPDTTKLQGFISGKIVDYETGEGLPYATIGIISKGHATVSNLNGEFILNIPADCINDSLSVSYLGYINRFIPVRQGLGNNFTINMIRDFIPIQEVIIRIQSPLEIMRKALRSIPSNYGTTPANMTGFYREAVIKRSDLQVYSEAIIHIYKSSYSGTLLSDQMKIIKSRKIENTGLKDTLMLRLKAGLSSCLRLDGVRNTFDFLDPGNFQSYKYMLTDIVTLNEESAYVIEFEQREEIDIPLYRGSVYINIDDFSIMMAEFELNPDYINDSKDSFVSNSTKGYSVRPVTAHYRISFRKINDRYYLSHVRGDLHFTAREKKRVFNTPFDVSFEMAITNISIDNVYRFERDEISPVHTIFSKTISGYDKDFWGDQDFLKPEDNLLEAIQDMNVRLFEFSEN